MFAAFDETVRYIFWTGGLDSTFRLMELLRTGDGPVQPIYLYFRPKPPRLSSDLEIRTMNRLGAEIRASLPRPDRLRPTLIRLRGDFALSPEIRRADVALQKQAHVGSQYRWLAQFCHDTGFPDASIEMCMPRHDPPSPLQCAIFEDPSAPRPTLKPGPAATLFRYYRFPTLHRSKAEMLAEARAGGFAEILEKTWFCHSPLWGMPCGGCNPCRIARAERTGIRYAPLGPQIRGLQAAGRRARAALF
jgi:hypothetical protein